MRHAPAAHQLEGRDLNRLHALWIRLRSSLWFLPTLIVLASIGAAIGLIESHSWSDRMLSIDWPRLFGAGAESSRAMLSAIATSMVTVAGVVFSVTVVSLSLASSQYSPRVLRNFMNDRPTQVVLGAFVGVFAYCLVVLRTIRSEEGQAFIPSIAVLVGIGYAFVAIALLIYFIHHVADSIQATAIIERIARETSVSIDRLFPEDVGEPVADPEAAEAHLPRRWMPVPIDRSGYLIEVDADGLLAVATRLDRIVRLKPGVGDFLSQGDPAFELDGGGPVGDDDAQALCDTLELGRERTVEQDAAFGLQQLVDVAVKALSPGINDPSTAVMCIDSLGALLARLAPRSDPSPYRRDDGRLRVIATPSGFEPLLRLSFEAVIDHAGDDVQVLSALVKAIATIESRLDDRDRRRALARQLAAVQRAVVAIRPPARARDLRRRARTLAAALRD